MRLHGGKTAGDKARPKIQHQAENRFYYVTILCSVWGVTRLSYFSYCQTKVWSSYFMLNLGYFSAYIWLMLCHCYCTIMLLLPAHPVICHQWQWLIFSKSSEISLVQICFQYFCYHFQAISATCNGCISVRKEVNEVMHPSCPVPTDQWGGSVTMWGWIRLVRSKFTAILCAQTMRSAEYTEWPGLFCPDGTGTTMPAVIGLNTRSDSHIINKISVKNQFIHF